jgi:hypothetical protein
MTKEISPEEKLFNIIQSGKDPASAYKQKRAQAAKGLNRFFPGLINELKHTAQGQDEDAPTTAILGFEFERIDLRLVNNALAIVLFSLIGLVVYFTANNKPGFLNVSSFVSPTSLQVLKPKAVESYKPLDYYIEEVKNRDIFRPVTAAAGVASPAKANLQAIAKDLSLSGIYQGKNSEAIIEDKTNKKVYFLKQGDEIKGLKVKQVFKDRVILQSGDEEVELL